MAFGRAERPSGASRRGTSWAWRPREAPAAGGSITEAIYGLILATSVIAVSREYESTDAGLIAVTVLVTGIVFWLAHVYAARARAAHRDGAMITRAELAAVLRHDWPLVQVTIPLLLILLLGAIGVLADRTAVLLAMLAALVELERDRRLRGARGRGARLVGVRVRGDGARLGGAVVLLKVLVH